MSIVNYLSILGGDKVKIEVRLFATFREGREKKYFLELEENITPKDILDILKISSEEVAILLINGIDGQLNKPLKDKDVLSLFPPVGGG
nr:MoaD/ThiS family protein [Clostridium aciditolerans]